MTRHACSLAILFLTICLACVQPAEAEEDNPPYYVEHLGKWRATTVDKRAGDFAPCINAGKLAIGNNQAGVELLDVASGALEVLPGTSGMIVEACAPDASFLVTRKATDTAESWHIIDRVAGKTLDLPAPSIDDVPFSYYPSSPLSPDGTRIFGPAAWGESLTLPSGKRLAVIPLDTPAIRKAANISPQESFPFQHAFWNKDSTRVVLWSLNPPEKYNLMIVLDVTDNPQEPFACRQPYNDRRDVLHLYPLSQEMFVADFAFWEDDAPSNWGLFRISNGTCEARNFLIPHYGVNSTPDGKIIYASKYYDGECDRYEIKIVDKSLSVVSNVGSICINDRHPADLHLELLHYGDNGMIVNDIWNKKITMFR